MAHRDATAFRPESELPRPRSDSGDSLDPTKWGSSLVEDAFQANTDRFLNLLDGELARNSQKGWGGELRRRHAAWRR